MVRRRSVVGLLAATAATVVGLHCVGEDPPISATPGALDGAAADVGPIGVDQGTDARPPHDAGFCAREEGPATRFCSDFDDGLLPGSWQGRAEFADAGLAILGDGAVSPPSALGVFVPAGLGGGGARLETTLAGTFERLGCSFHLRRDVVGENLVHIFTLDVTTSGDGYRLLVSVGATEARFRSERVPTDGGTGAIADVPAVLHREIGVFHELKVDVAPPEARLLDDDLVVARVPIVTAPPTLARLDLGVVELLGTSTAPWALRYDDVICRATASR